MLKFIAGTIFGIVIATVGFRGIVGGLDTAVETVKDTAENVVSKH